jgi:hypothetical protein
MQITARILRNWAGDDKGALVATLGDQVLKLSCVDPGWLMADMAPIHDF